MTSVEEIDDAGRSYVFNAAWQQERERLAAIEAIWDETTLQQMQAIGVSEDWRCLEVGGGGGSVAAWLSERVGPTGSVVATDLDTRFLEAIHAANLEARRHDVVTDELPRGEFDLVHCRLLLEHLPAADRALDNMIAALKPGGWLLVEEFDHVTFLPDPGAAQQSQEAWRRWLDGFGLIADKRGIDLVYGRRLFGLLTGLGLQDVHAEGRTMVERGGTAGRGLLRLSVVSLRQQLIDTGAIDALAVDELVSLLEDPEFSWTSQVMVSARGRRAV